jgi:hypothetical protein
MSMNFLSLLPIAYARGQVDCRFFVVFSVSQISKLLTFSAFAVGAASNCTWCVSGTSASSAGHAIQQISKITYSMPQMSYNRRQSFIKRQGVAEHLFPVIAGLSQQSDVHTAFLCRIHELHYLLRRRICRKRYYIHIAAYNLSFQVMDDIKNSTVLNNIILS